MALDISQDLGSLIVQQARATPDAVALEDETTTLTYAELEQRSGELARQLRRRGIGRDGLVGVLLGRSAAYVLACVAALRAGGAFLVLELAYPPSQLAEVIEDAQPMVVVTGEELAGRINADVPLVLVDGGGNATGSINNGGKSCGDTEATVLDPIDQATDDEALCFVSYTSGTTGRPKGIANPHRAAVRSYDLRFGISDVGPGDRVACNVFFVWEALRPLTRGATTVAVADEISYDAGALVEFLAARRVTETLMTPTLLAAVLSRALPSSSPLQEQQQQKQQLGDMLPCLRTLWLNGEVVMASLARRALAALPNVRLLNCYSASETHEIACGDIREMLADAQTEVCPVGRPLDPQHTYVLDEAGRRADVGVSGELHVGGRLLARGYLNLAETTASSFLPDPFDAGARMYRTGDTARLTAAGLLEITGRVGAMIKLRGYSVQPGAVEAAIVKHLAVRDCVVVAHGDGLQRQLVAYVVREPAARKRVQLAIDAATGANPLGRRTLSAHLAHYMIPSLWVELDALPTGVSGKADYARLPPPRAALRSHTAPRQDGSPFAVVVAAWAACLDIPQSAVTEDRDFFDLGGHSLSLADLAGRLTRAFGFRVPLARLAGSPTLQGHVDVVAAARDGHVAAVQADLPAVLRADSVLPEEIRPASTKTTRLGEAGTVLLTGATGFLGAFLLRDILARSSAQVICLVRCDDRPAGTARLRRALTDLGLWDKTLLDRVEVVPGNLDAPQLGLAPDTFDELAARVDVVVHAAAYVNLVYPYARLRAANVGGTREMLRLAATAGATVHHVSTNGVLPASPNPWPESAVVDADSAARDLCDGYGQSKWVAEQLVLEARRRGLPARIYRPGTLGGDSVSGATNPHDLVVSLLVESVNLGRAPDVDGWNIELSPVDFVSRAITTLADSDEDLPVAHLGDAPAPAQKLFGSLAHLGYPTEPLAWDEWVAQWTEKRSTRKTATVDVLRAGMPSAESLVSAAVLDDSATAPVLCRLGLIRPAVDVSLLETYTRDFYARGWLPSSPSITIGINGTTITNGTSHKRDQPLAGRVAVITGASSGIGAAIAEALAHDGADLALAARRASHLEDLQRKLTKKYGVRVVVQPTDVTDAAQVHALVAAAEQLGPVDTLVSCAGVMYFSMMVGSDTSAKTSAAEWDRTVDVNCKGLLHCLAAAVPAMVARGRGHVVALSSDAGRKVFPGLGVYSASKFFVEAALQALRLETAASGLRVTSVQPGNTATDLLSMSTDADAVARYGQPSGARILDPADVAGAVAYALRQPAHVAVNEVLIEPREEPV